MRGNAIQDVWYALAGIAWPVLVVAAMLAWPGPIAPQAYVPERALALTPEALPPVDLSGSITVFSEGDGQGASAVFWEVPEAGKVRVIIEIDPAAQNATTAEPDATAGTTPAP